VVYIERTEYRKLIGDDKGKRPKGRELNNVPNCVGYLSGEFKIAMRDEMLEYLAGVEAKTQKAANSPQGRKMVNGILMIDTAP
jgi:hypothetical protein